MKIIKSQDGASHQLQVIIEKELIFKHYQEFRNSYITEELHNGKYIVDFSHAEHIDSSGLGMILLLKDHAEKFNSVIELKYQKDSTIDKLFKVVKFDKFIHTDFIH